MTPSLLNAERRKDVIALAILAVVPTLLFLDVLSGSQGLYARDIAGYFHPLKKILREVVLGGEFPCWNRWFSAGQPLAANPAYQVFYPLTWLILLPSFDLGFQLLILSHIYIAMFGMYALLRSMRLRLPAAAFGALSFGIGGLVLSNLSLLPILFILAWLPLTCLFTRRYLLFGNRRDFAFAATFLGLQVVIGEPMTILQSGLLLLIYAIHRGLVDRSVGSVLRRVGAVVAISATAVLVAAVQILPAVDHAHDSIRSRGFSEGGSAIWSMSPLRMADMVYPDIFGNPDIDSGEDYWGVTLYDPPRYPFYLSLYSGLLVAVLAGSGLLVRAPGWKLVLAILAISLVIAAGDRTPFFALAYRLHLTSWLRYPEKYALMGVVALIVFAARMLDRLLGDDARLWRMTYRVTLAVALVAIAAAAVSYMPFYERLFRAMWAGLPPLRIPSMLAASQRGWIVAALRGSALFFLLMGWKRKRSLLWLAAIGAFVIVDLAGNVSRIAPRAPIELLADAPRVAEQFPPQRDRFRIFHYAAWRQGDKPGRLYFSPREGRCWIVRNALIPLAPASYGLETVLNSDYDATALLPTVDFTLATWELAERQPRGWIGKVASMSNVWYVAIYRPIEAALSTAGSVRDIQPIAFIEGRHDPRYYFARRVESIRDRRDFVRKLASDESEERLAFISGPSFVPAGGVVRSWSETANRATIEVEAEGRAFLVMSVTPHKYWRITIDGADVPAIVTNIGYQGVVVPRGRHTIVMRYRNPLIAVGAAISIATLVVLGLFVLSRDSRQRYKSTTAQSPLPAERGEG